MQNLQDRTQFQRWQHIITEENMFLNGGSPGQGFTTQAVYHWTGYPTTQVLAPALENQVVNNYRTPHQQLLKNLWLSFLVIYCVFSLCLSPGSQSSCVYTSMPSGKYQPHHGFLPVSKIIRLQVISEIQVSHKSDTTLIHVFCQLCVLTVCKFPYFPSLLNAPYKS